MAQAKGAIALLVFSERLPLRVLWASRSGQQGAWSRCPPRLQQPLLDFHQAAIGAGFRPDNKLDFGQFRENANYLNGLACSGPSGPSR